MRLYNETLFADAIEFADANSLKRKPARYELKVNEHVAPMEAGDMAKVACIEARETERSKMESVLS